MDGYAVRAAERPRAPASPSSAPPRPAIPSRARSAPGEAVRIFTGGILPEGADSILLQEDAEASEGERPGQRSRPPRSLGTSAWPRFRGRRGGIAAGRRLTARDIGLAAAANTPWLAVHRAPRIGILATGDEIALPGDPIPAGGIVSSNAHALAALVGPGRRPAGAADRAR